MIALKLWNYKIINNKGWNKVKLVTPMVALCYHHRTKGVGQVAVKPRYRTLHLLHYLDRQSQEPPSQTHSIISKRWITDWRPGILSSWVCSKMVMGEGVPRTNKHSNYCLSAIEVSHQTPINNCRMLYSSNNLIVFTDMEDQEEGLISKTQGNQGLLVGKCTAVMEAIWVIVQPLLLL